MNESIECGDRIEIPVHKLSELIFCLGYATVRKLEIEEIVLPHSSPVALLNISGESENLSGGLVGLCVMLAGKDDANTLLWCCCLMNQHQGNDKRRLFESLLIGPAVPGKTSNITIRIYGGKL
jgi:hypothetical protein